jgi:hypothetical protein
MVGFPPPDNENSSRHITFGQELQVGLFHGLEANVGNIETPYEIKILNQGERIHRYSGETNAFLLTTSHRDSRIGEATPQDFVQKMSHLSFTCFLYHSDLRPLGHVFGHINIRLPVGTTFR